MKKIFRVFYSQLFNSFFPVIILIILNKIIDKSGVSSIFLLVNYSNFYLLFTDYSSNVIFLKEALQFGGINTNTHPLVAKNINIYLGIKCWFLSVGFLVWLALCYYVPVLHHHWLSNILSYSFIIGYNLNFYWIYMSSKKEFYFIISSFFARLTLLLLLLLFIFTHLDIVWLMPIVGSFNIIIGLFYFRKFCNKFSLSPSVNQQVLQQALVVIKRDFNLMSSNFLLMTPTNCLYFFVGYVQTTSTIVVYGFAQQIFFGVRTLLSVFINSVYPGFCNNSITGKHKKVIFTVFYSAIIVGCVTLYYLENFIASFLHFSSTNASIFISSIHFFIVALLVLSLNVPFMLWAMLHNILHKKETIVGLLVASALGIGVFAYQSIYHNSVVSIAKSVSIAEAAVLLGLIFSYFRYKKVTTISLQQ